MGADAPIPLNTINAAAPQRDAPSGVFSRFRVWGNLRDQTASSQLSMTKKPSV
jgi:hypothetical protein